MGAFHNVYLKITRQKRSDTSFLELSAALRGFNADKTKLIDVILSKIRPTIMRSEFQDKRPDRFMFC